MRTVIVNVDRYRPSECKRRETGKVKGVGTHLEALLPVLVLLQELRAVDNDLSVGDLELEQAVVDGLGRLGGTDRLLEVDVEGPELEGLEEAELR